MGKDPAFLFYPNDYLGGTMGMTLEQKGGYMELLMMQFNLGRFTEAQAKQVLSICFDVAWPMLKDKFQTDGTFFWNQRLASEVQKRKDFTESRRINASGPKKPKKIEKPKKAQAKHMLEHMEDRDRNEDKEIEFEVFWEIYHKLSGKNKTDKDPALNHWNKLNKTEKFKAINSLPIYFISLNGTEIRYIKKARTFLADKSFNDEVNQTDNTEPTDYGQSTQDALNEAKEELKG